MRKKSLIAVLLLLMIVITGCKTANSSSKNVKYKYTGANENWKCEYTISEKDNDNLMQKTFIAKYTKSQSDLSSHKILTISYKTSAGENKMVYQLDRIKDNAEFTITSESDGILEDVNETIVAEINLDGGIEKINLTK